MKTILAHILAVALVTVCARATEFSVPDVNAPQQFAQRVLKSERASFTAYDVKKDEPGKLITIQDRRWIEQCSQILAAAIYLPQEHIFAVSISPISFFDKEGKTILRLEILPAGIIRLDSRDYRVGTKTCASLGDLLKTKETNQQE